MRVGPLENMVIPHNTSRAHQFKNLLKTTRVYAAEKVHNKLPKIVEMLTPVTKAELITVKEPDHMLWEYFEEKEVPNPKKPDEKITIKHCTVHNQKPKEKLMKEYHDDREVERKEYKDYLKHQRAIFNILLGQLCPTTVTNVEEADNYEHAKRMGIWFVCWRFFAISVFLMMIMA